MKSLKRVNQHSHSPRQQRLISQKIQRLATLPVGVQTSTALSLCPFQKVRGKHLSSSYLTTCSFKNLGNTCYINAILQSLTRTLSFKEDMKSLTLPLSQQVSVTQSSPLENTITGSLLQIIEELDFRASGIGKESASIDTSQLKVRTFCLSLLIV